MEVPYSRCCELFADENVIEGDHSLRFPSIPTSRPKINLYSSTQFRVFPPSRSAMWGKWATISGAAVSLPQRRRRECKPSHLRNSLSSEYDERKKGWKRCELPDLRLSSRLCSVNWS